MGVDTSFPVESWGRLGTAIRDARRLKEMSQSALAEKAGVSRAWLARVESGGHRRAEIEPVFRVLAALDLTLLVGKVRRTPGERATLAALANLGHTGNER